MILILVAAMAGFVGGTVAARSGNASAQTKGSELVRATRFELTNDAGQTLAFWGVDDRKNTVLAFGRREDVMAGANPLLGRRTDNLRDYKDELVAIGMYVDGIPFLELKGGDGKPRLELHLTEFEKPRLLMSDQNALKISLGLDQSDTHEATDDDWSLTFHPNKATIGMISDPVHKQVKGYLWLDGRRVK
jgi:hypothetical protein